MGMAKAAALSAAVLLAVAPGAYAVPAAAEFVAPAKDHRPETWFHLIGGNVSREGLDADLDAIAAAGIRGIQLFHGRSNSGIWPGVTNPVECLSRDWDALIRYAADACAKRGLSFKMQNCPGWSMSGGPWIEPENAMRNLAYSRTDAVGGCRLRLALPVPDEPRPEVAVPDAAARDYRDLFVLAFPTPAGDTPGVVDRKPDEKSDAGGVMRLVWRFPQPVAFRTVEIPSPSQMNHAWCYRPGVAVRVNGGAWRDVPQGCWQDKVAMSIALGETEPAAEWTVEFRHIHPLAVPYVRFREGARTDNWEGKAAWTLRGGMGETGPAAVASERCIDPEKIIDLTGRFSGGTLEWDAPDGNWTILRIGHVNNGKKNAPAPPEATGWECSKADRRGIDAHFAGYIGRLAKGPLAGGRLAGFIVDSWECCRQTWTQDMEEEFRTECGYDVRRLLPAVFGWVVGSPEATCRFLRDWRQTIGGLVERNYYGRMAELARENGLSVEYETGFGDVFPGDIMAFWKHCGTPMCEFWYPRTESFVGQDDFKPVLPCASAAHIYGKCRVAAEAFTTMNLRWDEEPCRLKACGNHAYARGVTHFVFHTYTHNPQTGFLPPGSSFGRKIGTPFLRGQTWWNAAMPEFTAWTARCETMLEAGLPANDILWFLGETVDHKPPSKSPFPRGFKYDYVNRDALLSRISVAEGGRFATPEGASWKVLWAPCARWRSPEVAAKLAAFVAAGGRVVESAEPLDVVRGLEPDALPGKDTKGREPDGWRNGEEPVEWLHRRAADGASEWYFVAPNGMDAYEGEVSFRVPFRVSCPVQLWDPADGSRCAAEAYAMPGGRTGVKLSLAPAQGVFVVFNAPEPPPPAVASQGAAVALSGWTLRFPAGWGAPESLALSALAPWHELPLGDEGRRFSGTATYSAKFHAKAGQALSLDLGRVESVATVSVNGRRLRTLWASPYRCEIPAEAVADGENTLEVAVTSTWYNRLAWDSGRPAAERKTWTHAAPAADAAPRPSGLLGPVTLSLAQEPPPGAAVVDAGK